MGKGKACVIRWLTGILQWPENWKSRQLLRKIGHTGKNCRIVAPAKIIGGAYITIGDDFYGGANCRLEAWSQYGEQRFTPEIKIGNGVKINSTCHIGAIDRITIGDHVLFGSHVFVTDHSHGRVNREEADLPPSERALYSKGQVEIEDNCWICENVMILPGVHIGRGAVVAAGAVVTKDVPAYTVAAGNPAKVVKYLDK
jgi:acetyltransferase-like isoleucine patch superfamily enzyme